MEKEIIFSDIDKLIDNWCENRNLNCLRSILYSYPIVSGLTDDWENLRSSLKDIQIKYLQTLSDDEKILLFKIIDQINLILKNR